MLEISRMALIPSSIRVGTARETPRGHENFPIPARNLQKSEPGANVKCWCVSTIVWCPCTGRHTFQPFPAAR